MRIATHASPCLRRLVAVALGAVLLAGTAACADAPATSPAARAAGGNASSADTFAALEVLDDARERLVPASLSHSERDSLRAELGALRSAVASQDRTAADEVTGRLHARLRALAWRDDVEAPDLDALALAIAAAHGVLTRR